MVHTVDVEEATAWKNGYFYFHNEDVKSAMEKIGPWYNVEIVYKGEVPKKGLDGTISRMEDLQEPLKALGIPLPSQKWNALNKANVTSLNDWDSGLIERQLMYYMARMNYGSLIGKICLVQRLWSNGRKHSIR